MTSGSPLLSSPLFITRGDLGLQGLPGGGGGEGVRGWNGALLGNCISLYLYRKYMRWRERKTNLLVAEIQRGKVTMKLYKTSMKLRSDLISLPV